MISDRIAKYIKANSINQSAVARKAGMKRQAMSDAMRGVRRLTADEYVSICNVLGVSLEFFCEDEDRGAD